MPIANVLPHFVSDDFPSLVGVERAPVLQTYFCLMISILSTSLSLHLLIPLAFCILSIHWVLCLGQPECKWWCPCHPGSEYCLICGTSSWGFTVLSFKVGLPVADTTIVSLFFQSVCSLGFGFIQVDFSSMPHCMWQCIGASRHLHLHLWVWYLEHGQIKSFPISSFCSSAKWLLTLVVKSWMLSWIPFISNWIVSVAVVSGLPSWFLTVLSTFLIFVASDLANSLICLSVYLSCMQSGTGDFIL